MITHPKCDEHGCQVLRDGGHIACDISCLRVADERATAAEQTASADESKHQRPALGFVQAQCIAQHAAEQGLFECAASRQGHSLHVVSLAADGLMPTHEGDDSPGAWTRRGARDGIVRTWQALPLVMPDIEPGDAELYSAAFTLTSFTVQRTIATERSLRGAS